MQVLHADAWQLQTWCLHLYDIMPYQYISCRLFMLTRGLLQDSCTAEGKAQGKPQSDQ